MLIAGHGAMMLPRSVRAGSSGVIAAPTLEWTAVLGGDRAGHVSADAVSHRPSGRSNSAYRPNTHRHAVRRDEPQAIFGLSPFVAQRHELPARVVSPVRKLRINPFRVTQTLGSLRVHCERIDVAGNLGDARRPRAL